MNSQSMSLIKRTIIVPALSMMPSYMSTASSIVGLAGVGGVESNYVTRYQFGNGPARGFWQMEKFTHDDIWATFMPYNPDIAQSVKNILNGIQPSSDLLPISDIYACMMARIKIYRAPPPLPAAGDEIGWASYWKTYYNTAGGAGTIDHAIPFFKQAQYA